MERTAPPHFDRKRLTTGAVVAIGVGALLAWLYRGQAVLIPPPSAPPPSAVAAVAPASGGAPGDGLAIESHGGALTGGGAAEASAGPRDGEPGMRVPEVGVPDLRGGVQVPGARGARMNARGLRPGGAGERGAGEHANDPNWRDGVAGRMSGNDVSLRHAPRRGPHDPQLAGYVPDPLGNGQRGFTGPGHADAALVARRARAEVDQWARNYCYRRALLADPALSGRVNVSITIDTTGHIARASAEPAMNRSVGPAAEFGACIERSLRGRVLPAPQGGEVQFHFALGLEPGGR